jgi:hypothetical protein
MVRLTAALVGVALLLTVPALAVNAPRLPSTAKKLTGAEIIKLYDGHTISFNNFSLNKPLSGQFTFNYKAKTISGTYVFGTEKGTFKGSIRISGDSYCYKVRKGKESCGAIYKDGPDIYEVNSMGRVISQNEIVR